jgi:hypothetical protein
VIRRFAIAAVSLVGVVTLTSCATFTENANAASVNGVELEQDTLEQYIEDVLTATRDGEIPDTLEGDTMRTIIGGWIVDELIRQFLAEEQIAITPDDVAAAEQEFENTLNGLQVSDLVRQFEVDRIVVRSIFERTQDPGALADIAARSDIQVDPRYGVWSTTVGNVVPLG